MSVRAGFVWETRQHFTRYIEDCGISCELITPHMLAAPFFRTSINCIIIPTGFANPSYSNLLPALRASSPRLQRFVESGGNLLVFGAATDKPGTYDWLPFMVTYLHHYSPRSISCSPGSSTSTLIDDYDASQIECDGHFSDHGAQCTGSDGTDSIILEKNVGKGTVVVTSIHEFPSRAFLKAFCQNGIQTLF